MIFYPKNVFRLKCSAFYWEFGTENRLQIHILVKEIQLFKSIAIGVKFL